MRRPIKNKTKRLQANKRAQKRAKNAIKRKNKGRLYGEKLIAKREREVKEFNDKIEAMLAGQQQKF